MTTQIVEMLIAERSKLDRAIEALTSGNETMGKRRGSTPPGIKSSTNGHKNNNKTATVAASPAEVVVEAAPEAATPTATKARGWTAEQRKAASERMKARFAAGKKAAKKNANA